MSSLHKMPNKQGGAMLLEALIAILLFMIGILAIIGLQAAAIKNAGDAKYRSEASLFANQLVGQMLVSNRAQLATDFQSPSGSAYAAWLANVQAAATGLPGSSATPPTVTIVQTTSTSSSTPSMQATIQIFWKAPNEPATAPNHQYIAVAQIN